MALVQAFVSNDCQGGAREDVSPSHPLPRHHQRLQQRQASVSQQSWLLRKREKKEKMQNVTIPNSRSSAPAAASGRLNAIDRFKGWS